MGKAVDPAKRVEIRSDGHGRRSVRETAGLCRPGHAAGSAAQAKAKAVIQIWLSGGPSHLDTFDPKPDAGYDYCGPLNHPIKTNVDGIVISELLPELAKQADKYSIIRSMTHGNNGHETAAYMVQTGHDSSDRLVYPPCGAVVSLFKGYDAGYRGLVPPYIMLTEPLGRFSEDGFLGPRYKAFATGGNPARHRLRCRESWRRAFRPITRRNGATCCTISTRSATH